MDDPIIHHAPVERLDFDMVPELVVHSLDEPQGEPQDEPLDEPLDEPHEQNKAAPNEPPAPEVNLSIEQQHIVAAALEGRNLFITGGAGVGKSFLLRRIRQQLEMQGKKVLVGAPTGTAAFIVSGSTLHGLIGLGLCEEPLTVLLPKARRNFKKYAQWRKADVLILDEVSMVHPDFFEKAAECGAAMRGRRGPFGGLQIICIGDFLQLPPVHKDRNRPVELPWFCFETNAWRQLNLTTMMLTESFRQTNLDFFYLLQRARMGDLTPEDLTLLRTRVVAPEQLAARIAEVLAATGVQPTYLRSTRAAVATINMSRLRQLPAYSAESASKVYEYRSRYVNLRALTQLESSQVSLYGEDMSAIIQTEDVPANLRTYAATQAENATTEARTLLRVGASVILTVNLDVKRGLTNGAQGTVEQFDEDTGRPLVRFGANVVLVPRWWWPTAVDNKTGGALIYEQIPLILGWALTIHRSQGLTLQAAIITVDGSIFEAGQAYVALSRLSSLEGLILEGDVEAVAIHAHPIALRFYGAQPL